MTIPYNLLILGGGSCAREFYYFAKHFYHPFQISFFDDITHSDTLEIDGQIRPIYHRFTSLQEHRFIIGVGEPHIKRILVDKALKNGLKPAPSIIHPSVLADDF